MNSPLHGAEQRARSNRPDSLPVLHIARGALPPGLRKQARYRLYSGARPKTRRSPDLGAARSRDSASADGRFTLRPGRRHPDDPREHFWNQTRSATERGTYPFSGRESRLTFLQLRRLIFDVASVQLIDYRHNISHRALPPATKRILKASLYQNSHDNTHVRLDWSRWLQLPTQ